MRRMQTWRWVLTAMLLAMGATAGRAEGVVFESFAPNCYEPNYNGTLFPN